jgi:hypothetical protein
MIQNLRHVRKHKRIHTDTKTNTHARTERERERERLAYRHVQIGLHGSLLFHQFLCKQTNQPHRSQNVENELNNQNFLIKTCCELQIRETS